MDIPKLAIVVSHPIQHFAPFYRALTEDARVKPVVLFGSRRGVEPYFDEGMQTMISWNMDLLGGYAHVFLPEADQINSSRPLDVNNPSIADELGRQAPDAVLIYGYNQLTSLRALWWCRRNKVPALMISDSELKTPRSWYVRLAKRIILPTILSKFEAFATVGDCNEEYYKKYGVNSEKLFRSPFSIDQENFMIARRDRSRLRIETRKEMKIANDEIVGLTVGKLSKRKRPHDALSAIKEIALSQPDLNVRFLFAGNGEMFEELKATVQAESLPANLLGFVNVDDLPQYYAASDFILHPSSRDPHPLVMSEAACVGLPLLVSDRVGAVGPSDIARLNENTLVFECGNIKEMTTCIEQLVSSRELIEQMGKRSIEIFDEIDIDCSVQGLVDACAYSLL